MKKTFPRVKTDEEIEALLEDDLSEYLHPGNFQPVTFEFNPTSKPVVRKDNSLTLGFTPSTNTTASAPTTPSTNTTASAPTTQANIPVEPGKKPDVLVPNPEITIDGKPAKAAGPNQPYNQAPPFLPRAVAPPVGDITQASIDTSPTTIDLGTQERVPRLVLREAPVREVLSLLARAAGLNLAYVGTLPGWPNSSSKQWLRVKSKLLALLLVFQGEMQLYVLSLCQQNWITKSYGRWYSTMKQLCICLIHEKKLM